MTQPHIYLHIGPHKTGTTAVQSALWANRATLLDQGILYPAAARYHFAQHRLAFALKGMPDPATGDVPHPGRTFAALRAELAQSRTPRAVLSSEEFFDLRLPQIRRLFTGLRGGQVTVIATVRHPVALMVSLHNQAIKDPGNAFTMPLARVAAAPRRVFRDLDMLGALDRYARVFGQQNIRLLHYEAGDMIAQVSDLLALKAPLSRADVMPNHRTGPKTADLVGHAKRAGLSPARCARVALMGRLFFDDEGAPTPIDPQMATRVMERLAPDYATLFDRYLGMACPYDTLPAGAEDVDPAQARLSMADLIRMIDGFANEDLPIAPNDPRAASATRPATASAPLSASGQKPAAR